MTTRVDAADFGAFWSRRQAWVAKLTRRLQRARELGAPAWRIARLERAIARFSPRPLVRVDP